MSLSESMVHGNNLQNEEGDEFDEEAAERERDAFEIEQWVEDFVDGPQVRHDVVPESDNDSNNSEEGDEASKIPKMRTPVRRNNRLLYTYQSFFHGVAFKECVLDYALKNGRNIKQYMYDKDKIGFKCVGGVNVVEGEDEGSHCEWKVYASRLQSDNVWKVRVFVDKHSCGA